MSLQINTLKRNPCLLRFFEVVRLSMCVYPSSAAAWNTFARVTGLIPA